MVRRWRSNGAIDKISLISCGVLTGRSNAGKKQNPTCQAPFAKIEIDEPSHQIEMRVIGASHILTNTAVILPGNCSGAHPILT